MQINVAVTDANNIVCEVVPPQTQTITIDRGVAGNGIVSIVPVTISTFQYLRITYTNGTVQDVGPLTSTAYTATSPITIVGNTISLATVPIASGGTDATTAAGAIQNLLPSYTGNANKRLGLNSGGTALEWVADGGGTVTSINASGGTTGLTFSGGPITSSGTLTLSGTLAVANGGTGVTSSTGTGSVVLSTSPTLVTPVLGTPTSGNFSTGTFTWPTFNQNTSGTAANITATSNSTLTTLSALSLPGSQVSGNISGNAANVTGVVAISNGGTGQTTANAAFNALAPSQTGNSGKYLTTDGSNTSWATNPLGTVTSVSGTGTVSGISLSGTVTTSGNLTLGGTLDLSAYNGAGAFTTISASSTVTLSGGTANGVAYLNGSKVVTSGSALTFDGTTVGLSAGAGNFRVGAASDTSTHFFRAVDNGGQSFYFGIDNAAGSFFGAGAYGRSIYSEGNYPIQFVVNSAEQMRLTSTGLGIGTSSPGTKLDVSYSDSAFNAGLRVTNTANTSASQAKVYAVNNAGDYISLGRNSTALGGQSAIFSTGAYPLEFYTNSTLRATLDSSGNLGLGVTPSAWGGVTAIEMSAAGGQNYSMVNSWIMRNAYYNGSSFIYKASAASTLYEQTAGKHQWYNAPSGTAGNAITFSQVMTLDASGNLGIGTSSPATKLHVSGSFGSQFRLQETGGTYFDIAAGGRFDLKNAAGTTIVSIAQSGSPVGTQLNLDSSGNLGLGVTPSAWAGYKPIQTGSGASFGGYAGDVLSFMGSNTYNDNTNWRYILSGNAAARYQQSAGTHAWYTAPSGTAGNAITFTQAMTLDASGNLIVGGTAATNTSSGRGNITINGSSSAILSIGTGGSEKGYIYTQGTDFILNASSGAFQIATGTAQPIIFQTNNTERARIDSSGNLLCGTTGTSWTDTVGFYAFYQSAVNATRNGAEAMNLNRLTSDGTILGFRRSGTQVGSVSVTTTATAYNTSSDYRLKDDPQTLIGSGEFIDALKPKTWNWKVDGSKGVGFLAHEAQAVSPSSVSGQKDAIDEEGKPIMQAMEYGSAEFIANIIAELQSLRQRVAQLEAQ